MSETYADIELYGTIVWSEDPWTFVTWNGSATFKVWIVGTGVPANVGCFTRYGIETESAAREAAREWFADQQTEMGEGR